MEDLLITTDFISLPEGKLFVKYWQNKASQLAPIILFHESLGCVEQWRDFPQQLLHATGRSVLAYDRIGFGQSTGQTGHVKVDFIFEEALHSIPLLLQRFSIEKFIAFGHSIGGGFAAGTAIHFPQCRALILESILAHSDEHMRHGVQVAQKLFLQPQYFARIERYHAAKAQSVLDAWTQSWLSDGLSDWSIVNEIDKIHCPTLLIHPEKDEFGHIDQAYAIINALKVPHQLALIAECGHVPHQEYPELVIQKISSFLKTYYIA